MMGELDWDSATPKERAWYRAGGLTFVLVLTIYGLPFLFVVQELSKIEPWWSRIIYLFVTVAVVILVMWLTIGKLEKAVRSFTIKSGGI